MYSDWRLRLEAWDTAKTQAEEGMDMLVLRNPLEDVYVKNLSKVVRDVGAGWRPEDWLEDSMLSWL